MSTSHPFIKPLFPSDPIPLALVMGSDREARLCDAVAAWLQQLIAGSGRFQVDVIDPLTLNLPTRMPGTPNAAVLNLRKRIDRARAIVLLTPEYNHGYSAALKHVIDLVVGEWAVKPVALVGYGGFSGGLHAIAQLRQVMAALDAVAIREALALPMVWNHLDDSGRFAPPTAIIHAAQRLLARLAWWSQGLTLTRQQPLLPNVIADPAITAAIDIPD